MGVFSTEGKLAKVLNRIADLVILNFVTILCCLPVFTIGAAMTALYSVTLKMAKNEEGAVVASYFRAFKANFKQATILWLIGGGIMAFIVFDIYLLRALEGSFAYVYKGVLLVFLAVVALIVMYIFPVLARFDNTTKNTAKNAALFCAIHIIQSILMLAVTLLPVILLFISPWFLAVDVLIGSSLPAYLTSIYYRSVFKDYETQESEEA